MGKKKHGNDTSMPVEISSSDPDIIPCRARSNRRFKGENSISKLKNKLDSGSLECYIRTIWSRFPENKRTSFTYLDCRWFAWDHWSLVIFCHLGESFQSKTRTPCVLLLDSLRMLNPTRLEPDIRKFTFDIYEAEGRSKNKQTIYGIPLLVPKVPQQRMWELCSLFHKVLSKAPLRTLASRATLTLYASRNV
ncbi:Cysteine proteinases superfamily protein, putative isoform 7 [Hibiscus syriacus]|uniref:Cysteine proteinases superfamily protein, putative isoform 7 n=1 Tax=Hibiscus syriacus TaxID=106335 RepID=A0A6A3CK60_HIBSY|nr:Cysteine proteinases superfamily protein, putative isoform 7 [Hibiscus syriacus]